MRFDGESSGRSAEVDCAARKTVDPGRVGRRRTLHALAPGRAAREQPAAGDALPDRAGRRRRRGRFPERHRARPGDGPRPGAVRTVRDGDARRVVAATPEAGPEGADPPEHPHAGPACGPERGRAASGGRSGPGPAFGEPPGSARAGRPSGRSAGVVGPCTGPPEDAVVFGVGGKSRRRAAGRTRPPSPPMPGRAGRGTRDCVRHGVAGPSATASPARPPRRRRPVRRVGRGRRRGGRPVPPPPPRRGVPGVPAADREGRRRPEGARVRPVPDDDPQDAGRQTLSGPPAALARAFPADRRRPARSGRALLRRDHRRVRPPRRLRERAAAGALGPRLPDPPRRRHHPRPRRPTMPTDQRDRALGTRSVAVGLRACLTKSIDA